MENRQQQILSEIKEMMASIRLQLELLDAKMAELQYEVDPQDFTMEPIDIQLEDIPADLPEDDDDLPFFESPEESPVSASVPASAPASAPASGQVSEPVCETPTIHQVALNSAVERPAVIDAMTARQAWRTDMPGTPVRDIRSAISLNDRVLFINRLFDEDPVSFQEALTAINQMSSLDEAVEYLAGSHPSWDFDSELVYRFMMAIRRKIS